MGVDENLRIGFGVSLPWELIQELDKGTKYKLADICNMDCYKENTPWVFFTSSEDLYLGKNGYSKPETYPLYSTGFDIPQGILKKFFAALDPATVEILQPLLEKYKDEVIIGKLAFHYWS